MHSQYENLAIHWVPRAGSALEAFGTGWTGWCAESGSVAPVPERLRAPRRREGVPGRIAKLGFHANVKSPFRLAGGRSIWSLDRALEDLADRTAAIRLPKFELTVFDRQVVLALVKPSNAVTRLLADVADVVRLFQVTPDYAAMPGHGRAPLPGRRDWGSTEMPVLERFHLPLTDRLDLGTAYDVVAELAPMLAPVLAGQQLLADLALVGDPGGGRPWRLIERYELRDTPVRVLPTLPSEMSCQGPQLITPFGSIAGDDDELLIA